MHELIAKAGEKPVDVSFEGKSTDLGDALIHLSDVKEMIHNVKAGLKASNKTDMDGMKAELAKPITVNVTELPKVRENGEERRSRFHLHSHTLLHPFSSLHTLRPARSSPP